MTSRIPRRISRAAGLAAVATLWVPLAVAVHQARFDLLGDKTLSELGTDPASSGLFTASLATSAVLFVGFLAYIRAVYTTDRLLTVVYVVGFTGQFVAAFVRIGGAGPAHRIHVTTALVLGASLPVLMGRFASVHPTVWARRLFRAEVAACVIGVLLSRLHVAAVAEIVPAAVFHAWIGVLTIRTPPGGTRSGRRPPR